MANKNDYFLDADDRNILLNEVDESSISNAIQSIFTLVQKDKKSPINIVINTYGGSIYDMLALYDTIKYVQSLGAQINTIGLGKIMSAGVVILVSGNTRKIGQNSTIMWHWGSDSIEGDMFDLKNEIKELARLDNLCNNILVQETNMSQKDIESLLSPRVDIYITPDEAMKYGMVDGLLETVSTRSQNKKIANDNKRMPTKRTKTVKK